MTMVPYTTRLKSMVFLRSVQTSTLNLRVMDSHGVGWETERIFLVARAVSQLSLQGVQIPERTQAIVLTISTIMNDNTETHESERSDFLGRIDFDDLFERQFRLLFLDHLSFGESTRQLTASIRLMSAYAMKSRH